MQLFSGGSTRYTPTRVGKTYTQTLISHMPQVHPHACGENYRRCANTPITIGTPPRVWGKLPKFLLGNWLSRYTPTRVGKTQHPQYMRRGLQVHPHACGENPTSPLLTSWGLGTPPRVWGKHSPFFIGGNFHRYTPTRVGKTLYGRRQPE